MRDIGRGTKAFDAAAIRGRWRVLADPLEVIQLIGGGAAGLVAVVPDAGATFLAPIFEDLAAVICRSGTPRSHIGIVSREYGIPCVVGAQIEEEPPEGAEVEVDCSGEAGVVRLVI